MDKDYMHKNIQENKKRQFFSLYVIFKFITFKICLTDFFLEMKWRDKIKREHKFQGYLNNLRKKIKCRISFQMKIRH